MESSYKVLALMLIAFCTSGLPVEGTLHTAVGRIACNTCHVGPGHVTATTAAPGPGGADSPPSSVTSPDRASHVRELTIKIAESSSEASSLVNQVRNVFKKTIPF
ncbi:hypothetical protein ElyMa_002061400 [Elysia marginata]|uniref:Cytochrome c domain-containing protein n=1 Tax=Elysia marginata TaxID=1093978 RepID=A0AAV4FAE5_9GAST|nr:hypothetical protein ElyMa_002061400 [Elysia marginata]